SNRSGKSRKRERQSSWWSRTRSPPSTSPRASISWSTAASRGKVRAPRSPTMTISGRCILASEPKSNTRTAAQLLVAELEAHGIDRIFCVPGESYLAVLDALYGRPIEVVTCRHESGAGFMAVADAKLMGRPGICFVSRGPGASNAAIAVHTAQQDAAPLILFVGQVERKDRGRGAFQEVNYERTFGDMAKLVVEVSDPSRLAEITAQAFHVATIGAPGPVVVVLP